MEIAEHVLYPKLKDIPRRTGVYVFYDKKNNVLYVGKAKNLNARIKSYFYRFNTLQPAKQDMIRKAVQLDYIIVSDETEALLLESDYIKRHKPPYNVVWKDDKKYLFLYIDWSEAYPRIKTTRTVRPGKQRDYFGPYPSASTVRNTLKLLHRIFPFRTCDRDLSKTPNGTVCLLYHIKQCLGPCENKCSETEYTDMMRNLADFLRGNTEPVITRIESSMRAAAHSKKFEVALRYRDRLDALKRFMDMSVTIKKRGLSADVLNIGVIPNSKTESVVNIMSVRYGRIINREQWRVKKTPDASEAELFESFIAQFYSSVPKTSLPKEIYIPISVSTNKILGMSVRVPKTGEKRALLELGQENANIIKYEHQKSIKPEHALQLLADELKNAGIILTENGLRRIECYDISNMHGMHAYGSQSVFIDGKPKKSEYRSYAIRSVSGPNDVAMHGETIARRLRHSYNVKKGVAKWEKPDLIVIDGGEAQLSTVVPVVASYDPNLPVVGITKEEETIIIPGGKPLQLSLDHPGLQLIQRIRDEAHRFGIEKYRAKHVKKTVQSEFDSILGVGPKRKKTLKQKYGTLARAKQAPESELASLLGEHTAKKIRNA